jgi:para-aminobenzoate synthetase/4-amino-4-deoxychorismate lyase
VNPARVQRVPLDLGLEPVDVLRRLRGAERVAALIGDWHQGEALIACDPIRVAAADDDPFAVIDEGDAGWWIGSWGYRLGGRIESLPVMGERPVPQPEHRLALYDVVLRLVDGAWFVEHLPDADPSALIDRLAIESTTQPFDVGTFTLTPDPDGHRRGVARALDHITAGDIFQVNLCARMEASFSGDPVDLFCSGLEALAPAYAAFIDGGDGAIASFSPELFLRRTGDEVLSSPIKGTAPLDSDVSELVASAKDRAENVMIVDLMRNDLGRVSTPGSVRVPALVRPERHAVWHLVSDVVGHVGHDVPHSALLRATFPPGSVTGAPKVRAMEIAAELEPTSREAYTGAIGHASPDGTLELNVAIRTFEIAENRVWLGVGGGVVADSTPDGEYAELLVKARPLVDAIGGLLDSSLDTKGRGLETSDAPTPLLPVTQLSRAVDVTRGVFTTLLVLDGDPVDLEAHIARLDASVRAVYGTTVRAGLEDAVRRKSTGLAGRHRLRIDAIPVPDSEVPQARSACREVPPVTVRMSTSELHPPASTWRLIPQIVPGGLGQHKWIDRSALGAVGPDYDPLLIDTDGSVLESGRANVFVVLDDGVHTAPLDGRILPGTARARIIEQLTAAGVPVLQRRLTSDDFARASEVFVSNTLRGVVPITSIEGMGAWAPGPLAAALIEGRLSAPPSAQRTWPASARVLFIDNYDSFVYNLVQYVRELGGEAEVVRNDAAIVEDLVVARERGDFTHLIVSPGPGAPAEAGVSVDLIRRLGPTTPVLGVCLGHQAIGEAFGAKVVRASEVVHGKPSLVHHDGRGVYRDLPSPLTCARYHSLVIEETTLPAELEVTARTASGIVMGVRHTSFPVEGVQMHPESILTAHGHDLLANFLRFAD